MPSTHLCLHYHFVFSTKRRQPLIDPSWRSRMHEYLGGVMRRIGVVPEAVGGTADHVHLLAGLRATHRVADVLREVKGPSSAWAHEEIGARNFSWQSGYGGFTVSPSLLETVKQYILRQEEHHRRRSFEEEYTELLRLCGVEYDERYLWDD